MTQMIRVWDWTVRAAHWLFVVLFALMWWTAEEGLMDWHTRIGIAMLAVLLFRIYWGIFGPSTARFSALLPRPRRILGYLTTRLRRPYTPTHGHNPLGALSVIALLVGLSALIGTGLFSADVNGFAEGPLAFLLDFGTARDVAGFHEQVFGVLQALVVLHVVAIAVYWIGLGANLVGPMVTGTAKRKVSAASSADPSPASPATAETVPDAQPDPVTAPIGRVLIGLTLTAAIVAALINAGP